MKAPVLHSAFGEGAPTVFLGELTNSELESWLEKSSTVSSLLERLNSMKGATESRLCGGAVAAFVAALLRV